MTPKIGFYSGLTQASEWPETEQLPEPWEMQIKYQNNNLCIILAACYVK